METTKERKSGNITSLKSVKKQPNKSSFNSLFRFPKITQSFLNKANKIKKGKFPNFEKFGKVKELQLNMFDENPKEHCKYI